MKKSRRFEEPLPWLPIDSRLLPLIVFPHVRGVARIFLIIEMILCLLVVIGTLVLVVFRLVVLQ